MACFIVLIPKTYSYLGCSMAEFRDLTNGFDNILYVFCPAGLNSAQYNLPHVFVTWLVDIDKRHAKRLGSSNNITVNISMVTCLDSLLELLNGLSCEFLWNTMLYHIVDVPIKYLVKIHCGSTNGMVSNNCITLKLLCKHQLCGSYVYSDQHFAYVLTFYMHGAVCRHFLPAGKLKPHFHYSICIYSHGYQSAR